MSTAELLHAQPVAPRRRKPQQLGALALALIALELVTILLMLPTLSAQVDKTMSASPLVRTNMRAMIYIVVLVFMPLFKVMAAAIWALLVNALRQLCRLNGDFLDAALASFTAALCMGVGRVINALLGACAGGHAGHDYFALGNWLPLLAQQAGWFARLGLWDVIAFAVFVAVMRARAASSYGVALAFGTMAWLVPLLAFYRVQQIMGH